MTIFHTIQYSDIDIYDEIKLNKLPVAVLDEWFNEIKGFVMDLLDELAEIETTYPIVDIARSGLDHFGPDSRELRENIGDLEEVVREATKDTLRSAGDTNYKDVLVAECIPSIFSALTDSSPVYGASDFLDTMTSIDTNYACIDFGQFFRKRLMILLMEFDV